MDTNLTQKLFEKAEALDIEGMKTLLSQGADIESLNDIEENLLSVVVRLENAEQCIIFLLDNGFDINSQDHYASSTALIQAANHSKVNNVEILLKEGADPNLVNSDGQTALTQAVATRCFENVQLLLDHGADVNRMVQGDNALMTAVSFYKGDRTILDFLLARGANINAEDGYGTALWSAIAGEKLDLIKFLISRGAKIEGIKSIHNETTLEFANRVGNQEVIDYLKSQINR